MKLIFLLSLIFLTACSTNKHKNDKKHDKNDAEFSWVENADFVPPPQVKFNENVDEYSQKDLDELDDTFGNETLAKVSKSRLSDISNDGNSDFTRAMGLCYNKKFKNAHLIFKSIYRKYKKHAGYWNLKGVCYLHEKSYRKAVLYFNKSRELSPKYAAPYNNLGVILERKGKYQKALAAYKKANSFNPFSITPKFNMAQIYLKYGLIQKSEKLFRNVLRKAPGDIDSIVGIATGQVISEKYNQAIELLSKVDEKFLKRPDIGINYAYSLFKINRKNDSKVILDEVDLSLDSSWSSYYKKIQGAMK
jgi:tetratricopeptide (TPR) repeat protein